MRQIILAIGIRSAFVRDEGVMKKIDFSEIIALYPELLSNPINCKPKAIIKYIDDSEGDLIIGNGIDNVPEYNELRMEINHRGIKIIKMVFKYPTYSLSKYKQQYSQHARWMDYSPEAAEEIAKEYINQIHLLEEQVKKDGINVEVIDGDL